MKQQKALHLIITLLCAISLMAVSAAARQKTSSGQKVYVPVYSHIYYGDRERPFLLSSTLSIRNTDMQKKITVITVDYHDTEGKLIKKMITKKTVLRPLETIRFVISESDKSGGSGAKFIVEWRAEKDVTAPLIETVMIGTRSGQGISFTSRGVVIQENSR